jgi:hypothetical protein
MKSGANGMSCDLNFVGGGIHEVAALRSDGALVAGHFDNADAADAAIAQLGSDYKAAWSSLNQVAVLPDGRTLNPSRLSRGARIGAKHISRRVSLLFDFDPDRPTGVMSTDAEHEAALEQAWGCREWLRSLGWPLLPLCDSGSGAHLRPLVEMDVSVENNRLIQRTLAALRQRFRFADVGMWDLPRLCRYYGSWNRKGPHHTDGTGRMWRQSAVLEEGERTPVTAAHLEALCELMRVPVIQPSGDGIARPQAVEKFVRRFTAYAEGIGATITAVKATGTKTLILSSPCLLHDDHDGGVGVTADGIRCVQCFHNRCKSLGWGQWSKAVEQKHGPMRLDGGITWKK